MANASKAKQATVNSDKRATLLQKEVEEIKKEQFTTNKSELVPFTNEVVTEPPSITAIAIVNPLAPLDIESLAQASFVLNVPLIKPPKRSPWSLGIYAGVGMANRQLAHKLGAERTVLLDRRNELETPEQVIAAGANVQYQFKSGWFLKSGLAYEQITERFDYQYLLSETDFYNEDALNTVYRMADGTTEMLYGTNSVQQITQTRMIYNRYRTIDVPLMLGYNQKINRRLAWYVEGGALLNLSFLPRGEILAIDNETIIDLTNTDILKQRTGLSAVAGLGVSYRIANTLSVWASPQFRYALGSMTADNYDLDQSFIRGMVQVGIQKQL